MFYSKYLNKEKNIQHCFFSRRNGNSKGIYESLNCGPGSKDNKSDIKKNLEIVSKKFNVAIDNLVLMNQTHSNKVQIVEDHSSQRVYSDAVLTKNTALALCVLTADCAPILIYEKQKEIVGAIHAGWKGAFNGIIENTTQKIIELGGSLEKLVVTIGPCISQESYEVKDDFLKLFLNKSKNNKLFFTKNHTNSFNFNLRGFLRSKFNEIGVKKVDNIELDTFSSKNEYFSHRRAKKLGENDYGRCISVIRKINIQK